MSWGDSGPGDWTCACKCDHSLLIWPQEDDVVPPGMESLISAPLVKTSEKEEEQVSLWGGPSELEGVKAYPPDGM